MTLGASRFASAIGISPYKSRKKLWRQMTNREPKEEVATEILQWGLENEEDAAMYVSAVTGEIFSGVCNQRKFTANEFHATPDGFTESRGLEVKVRSAQAKQKLWDTVPDHYMCQIQGQCLVCGFEAVYFGCYYPAESGAIGRVWLVHRDEKYIEWMEGYLHEFLGYLTRDEEPPRLGRKPKYDGTVYVDSSYITT